MKRSATLALLSAGLLATLCAGQAVAQSLLMRDLPSGETRFDLGFTHPHFKQDARLSTLSGVYELAFDAPLSARLNLIGRLPIMRFTFGEDQRETGFGNIYVGVQTRPEPEAPRALSLAFGIYAPTLDRDKPELGAHGWITNPYQIEETITDCVALRIDAAQRYSYANGAFVGWEYATSMLFPVHRNRWAISDTPPANGATPVEDFRNNIGVHLHGGVGAGLRGQRLTLLAECATEYWATARGGTPAPNRFYPVVAVGAEYRTFWVRPTVYYMFQLDDHLSARTNASIGLKVELLPFGAAL